MAGARRRSATSWSAGWRRSTSSWPPGAASQQYIAGKILPALGDVQVRRITVEVLDCFYAELRKRGGAKGQPLAAMTVHQIHFIIRAALNLAVKWEWIPSNSAEKATIPRYTRQEVAPPTPEEVARFIEAAWARDPDFGVFLWVAVVTGARRGEVCGLRWTHVRLEQGYLVIARSLAQQGRLREEKDTKTHQSRRVALDVVKAEVLAEHKARCEQRAAVCGVTLDPKGFVFSTSLDGREPLLPSTVSGRVSQLSKRLGLQVNLRNLRHYATTLKVYTHFLPAPDLRAAQVLARGLPRPPSGKS
ncbi:MAG: tyrosine-type recombinase/integrase [Egibacteraceae bacterium]